MRRGPAAVAAAVVALVVAGVVAAAFTGVWTSCAIRDAGNVPVPEPPDPAPAPAPARNVLVIVLDTTRADRCGFLGWDRTPTLSAAPDSLASPTPRLDALAPECLVFEDAWSVASWTFPSHAALFTGIRPDRLGFYDTDLKVLGKGEPTLAETLGAAGFATGCFTNNPWIDPLRGMTRGFETVESLWKPEKPGAPSVQTAARAHAAALAWMDARRAEGRRFLAFINDMEAHGPRDPSPEWAARFLRAGTTPADDAAARAITDASALDLSLPERLSERTLAAYSDLYDAEIATMDDEVGKLLDALRASGALDETLVVVLSDHGEGLGQHGWLTHGCFLHRELLRVPLVLRLPQGRRAGRVKDLVRIEDVFPTVLEVCGLPPRGGIDGLSLLGDTADRTAFAFENVPNSVRELAARMLRTATVTALAMKRRSVRRGRYHLIADSRGGTLLYDVVADPGETNDLAAAKPAVVAELQALLGAR